MSGNLTITYDLEDDGLGRYEPVTDRLLEYLDERGIKATVFVVGELARRSPALVARIRDAGHEIGLHGMRHVPITELGEEMFEQELHAGKALLEDMTGRAVLGYRAPIFSIVPSTAWAPERIARAGFAYSSSVLPAPNPLHGFPGAPRRPFRWPSGLVELPCPVLGRGRLALPFLGGVYLRYLPRPLLRAGLSRLSPHEVAWSYLHPYDFDHGAPFHRLPHASWLVSRILHHRRAATFDRLGDLLSARPPGPPLGEGAQARGEGGLPVFNA